MNNLKIKFYKKEDLASLRKYKRAIIILLGTCLLLASIIVIFFLNKDIIPSIYAAKPIEVFKKTDKKEIIVASSHTLFDSLIPAEKNSINNTSGLKQINGFAEQQKVIIQNKKPSEIYHIVEKGQTLYSISKMYNANINTIKKLNKIKYNTIYLHDSILVKTDY